MISNDLACIASGPSIISEDCELVRQAGLKILVVNSSWKMAPHSDYLYGGDFKWWKAYKDEVKDYRGEKWTCSDRAHYAYGINYHQIGGSYNSGLRAIQFGIMKGFKNIILLGYDCSVKNGLHWHKPHSFSQKLDSINPTALKVKKWQMQFEKIAEKVKLAGVNIINCSRYTELKCFVRMSLIDAIDLLRENADA